LSDEQVAAAVRSVAQDYRGLAVILERQEIALPLLRQAHAAATEPEQRLVYANILGMLGDATGVETLIEAIQSQSWDKGWNFRGMGQFGGSISRLDSLIIALGWTGDPRGLPAILGKVKQLDASKEFSHHRAVALALEALRAPAAAEPLAELLSAEGMTGYALTRIDAETKSAGHEHRSQPLREIILARALYRCGDHDGLGEKILRTYEKDLRGLFAKHAHAVLNETPR
jgi:HEAT repeat protein